MMSQAIPITLSRLSIHCRVSVISPWARADDISSSNERSDPIAASGPGTSPDIACSPQMNPYFKMYEGRHSAVAAMCRPRRMLQILRWAERSSRSRSCARLGLTGPLFGGLAGPGEVMDRVDQRDVGEGL